MMWIKKFYFILLLTGLPLFGLSGQQKQDEAKTVFIKAIPGLQYDLVRFTVKPGEKVKLVFSNEDDMGHNLLITTPGSRLDVVNAALQLAEKGPEMNYIPDSPQILWAIPVIYGGENKTLEFKAPDEPGAYPYVCTYPGHGFLMYGVMYVSPDGKMPEIKDDQNIPESRRKDSLPEDSRHQEHSLPQEETPRALHPYEPVPPYLYRVFIENSGLASIAVHLPNQLSYVWDAGACRLRFAWEGGFLDNTDLWHGHKNAYAKVLGEIFYRDRTTYPLRVGNPQAVPETEYLGYSLINRYPEFHYLVAGKDVFELVQSKPEGDGLIRTFRMPGIDEPVWFMFDREDGVVYEASTGNLVGRVLELSPDQAKKFTITMTKKKEK